MIKSLILFTTLLLATAVATVQIDPVASQVTWKGYKVTGGHEGTIGVESGTLDFEDGVLVGGAFAIDMASLANTDLDSESAAKLEGHLKSEDFFGVDKYPTAKFNITNVTSRGLEGDYKVTGDLTIKSTTKEVKFNANVVEEMGKYVATADINVDRSDFDVRYGSGSFFDNLGDKTIYDEFDLAIRLVTKK